MPIESTHPEYDANEEKWTRARDVMEGADAIKRKNEVYLPRLSSQTEQEYIAYRDRTPFFNGTKRTHQGLVGQLFRKVPTVNISEELPTVQEDAMNNFWADADLKGNTLETYARSVAEEIMEVGRGGTLVDWSEEEGQPYLAFYQAEDIWDWKLGRVNGATRPVMIKLHEIVENENTIQAEVGTSADKLKGEDDPFETTQTEQLRVLRLVPKGAAEPAEGEEAQASREWIYIVEIWQKVSKETGKGKNKKTSHNYELTEILEPKRTGKNLTEIPFVFHGSENSEPSVDRPPLDDLIEMNLDHYRTSADYKHGLHFTALPTAWVAGFGNQTVLRLGSTEAWVSEHPEARAGFLEFEGKGLSEFNVYLSSLEAKMAVLGARMLESQKREAETAEAMSIRQGGEISVLQHISGILSDTLTLAMKWALWWTGTEDHHTAIEDEDSSIGINTDFIASKMSAKDVLDLVNSWIQGGISRDTLHWNLAQGERLPPGRTPEEELELIEIDGALGKTGGEEEPINEDEEEDAMEANPYSVEKKGGKWAVVKNSNGKVMGTHDTKEEALKQLAALEAAE